VERECVNLASEKIGQRLVDHPVASQQFLIRELIGYHDHLEVRLRTRLHAVLVALVYHLEVLTIQPGRNQICNLLLYAHS